MTTRTGAWALFAAAACACALLLAGEGRKNASIERLLAHEESRHSALATLEKENRWLTSEQLPAQERRRLEDEHRSAQVLRTRIIALQGTDPARSEPSPKAEASAKDWRYEGSASPKEAMLSVLWAASRGDVDELAGLIGFDPDVGAKAESLFENLPAQARLDYGSPEKIVATLLSGTFPKDASGAVFADASEEGSEASVTVRVNRADGQSRMNSFRLDHTNGGWRLLVPGAVLSGYEQILEGETLPPENASP